MDEEKSLKKIITWAGVLALLAIPVYLAFKKRKSSEEEAYADDDSSIFAAELEE